MSIANKARRAIALTKGAYDVLSAAWALRSALRADVELLPGATEELAAARARVAITYARMTEILSRGAISIPIHPTVGEESAEHSDAADFVAHRLQRIREEAARHPLTLSYVTAELEDLERVLRRSARAAAASATFVH